MALLDKPDRSPVVPDAARTSDAVRQALKDTVDGIENGLQRVRQLVARHGRPAVAAELDTDAAALLTVYNALKNVLELAELGRVVDDLPA